MLNGVKVLMVKFNGPGTVNVSTAPTGVVKMGLVLPSKPSQTWTRMSMPLEQLNVAVDAR